MSAPRACGGKNKGVAQVLSRIVQIPFAPASTAMQTAIAVGALRRRRFAAQPALLIFDAARALVGGVFEIMLGETQHVAGAFAQRRQEQRNDIQSVE